MTISVKVQNSDSRENAVIVVKRQSVEGKELSHCPDIHLTGGKEVEVHVHSTQRLVVEEVRSE